MVHFGKMWQNHIRQGFGMAKPQHEHTFKPCYGINYECKNCLPHEFLSPVQLPSGRRTLSFPYLLLFCHLVRYVHTFLGGIECWFSENVVFCSRHYNFDNDDF